VKSLPKLLSKTKIMRGYRCLKNIYLTVHNPDLEAAVTPDQQALFDQGNFVGEEARKRFPGGVLIDNKPWDFFGSLKRTRELLAQKTEIIYEAAFEYNGCYARADIIQYSKDTQRWKIFEVKSSTKVKDEHIDDVGLQAWIMAKSGLPIEQISVLYINNACRFPNLQNLFVAQDLTEKLRSIYPEILPKVSEIFSVIQKDKLPSIDIGQHCTSPNDCGFKDFCWKEKNIPDVSVLDLPQLKTKKWEYYSQGILKLDDPRLSDLSPLQERVVQVFKSGARFVDASGIQGALKTWQFPLIFLDFETINPAIPRYEGTTPYQQVPFQFSVHIWPSPESELIHKEYLHVSKTDPRPNLIPALLQACGDRGSIVAYYGQFESSRITELAAYSSKSKKQLESLIERIVDPLPVIRNHVYDNKFAGSFSLKAVAPAILGDSHSYDGMLVANGTAAQRAFEELIDDETPQNRKDDLIRASLEYCEKDTLVMVELVKWLYREADKIGR
jgi:Domain of unknown function(DUF2779)/Domain of unknown function DUF83